MTMIWILILKSNLKMSLRMMRRMMRMMMMMMMMKMITRYSNKLNKFLKVSKNSMGSIRRSKNPVLKNLVKS